MAALLLAAGCGDDGSVLDAGGEATVLTTTGATISTPTTGPTTTATPAATAASPSTATTLGPGAEDGATTTTTTAAAPTSNAQVTSDLLRATGTVQGQDGAVYEVIAELDESTGMIRISLFFEGRLVLEEGPAPVTTEDWTLAEVGLIAAAIREAPEGATEIFAPGVQLVITHDGT